MKIIFWLCTVLTIPAYLLLTFFFVLSQAIGGYRGTIGAISGALSLIGSFTIFVGIAGTIFGIYFFVKKKRTKPAFLASFAGLIYGLVILVCMLVLNVAHTVIMNKENDKSDNELYGENWNAPSNFQDIPDLYEEVLNKLYVAVNENWTEDQLTGSELYCLKEVANHYGDSAADSIGFAVADLNADGTEELVIGTAGRAAAEYTTVFAVYYDPANPHPALSSVEGTLYFPHNGENGLYRFELGGYYDDGSVRTGTRVLYEANPDDLFAVDYTDTVQDPAGRLKIDLIPLSEYK